MQPRPTRPTQRELVMASLLLCPDARYASKERGSA
jgi:hypothetical protein